MTQKEPIPEDIPQHREPSDQKTCPPGLGYPGALERPTESYRKLSCRRCFRRNLPALLVIDLDDTDITERTEKLHRVEW